MKFAYCILFVLLSLTATATQPAAPVLAELDVVKIQAIELQAENIQLKIAALQASLVKLDSDARAYIASLQKEGFTLERNDKGQWIYTPQKK